MSAFRPTFLSHAHLDNALADRYAAALRAAHRFHSAPDNLTTSVGFRLAWAPAGSAGGGG